ncbi:hypothetical protein R9C00_06810 [Flammeovirgaceae bacterium SG7u.111]|nr:hypothetical protein [Flammeovirgaceae bacterium SG7u.132]WPO37153.1 hypothetical protein R9C00_06810 [Flammeovirgaceae bacterium SG7u.111]
MEENANPINNTETPKRKENNSWRKTFTQDVQFLVKVAESTSNLARANDAGFTKGELETMIAVAKQVITLDIAWEEMHAKRDDQYSIFRQSMDNLEALYIRDLTKARRIFDKAEEKGISKMLKLEGKRPQDISNILDYITKFYSFILSEKEIGDRLKKRNITPELAQQLLALTEEVTDKHILAQRKAEEAVEATETRNTKRDEFYSWFKDFKATPVPKKKAAASSKVKAVKA